MPMLKIADSLRLHENCGTSQAVCMPMMKIAESLKLFGSFGHTAPENGGKFHAVCMEMMKLQTGSGSEQFLRTPLPQVAGHDMPMLKIADSLRLCAPAVAEMAGRLRRLARP